MTGDVGDVVGQDVIIVGLVYVIEWISSIINTAEGQSRRGQREMRGVWGKANGGHGGRLVGVDGWTRHCGRA
jgi:hypothetical protein